MSGHSKWANIKRAKGANDLKRAKVFTKLSRAITVAARKGGSADPESNPGLRKAMDDARSANVPKDNIERAVAKGLGGDNGQQMEEITLEAYGPWGVAILLMVLTDNRNRTLSEVRSILTRYGGSLGNPGSAAYIFANDPENPSFSVPVSDVESSQKVLSLVNALEDLDDVQKVYSNFDIADEILEQAP